MPEEKPDGRVHAAVKRGVRGDALRQVIEEVAQGSEARRFAAVNEEVPVRGGGGEEGGDDDDGATATETAIAAAHQRRDKDQISVLLLAGALPQAVHEDITQLTICVAYDLPETLAALLASGAVDADEEVPIYKEGFGKPDFEMDWGAAHLCITPPELGPTYDTSPRLACLRVLAQHGLDVNEVYHGYPPVVFAAERNEAEAVRVLVVELGADVEGHASEKPKALGCAVQGKDMPLVRLLLSLGASTEAVDELERTALIVATDPEFFCPEMAQLVLSYCSTATRRRVSEADGGKSALDFLLDDLFQGDSSVGVGGGSAPSLPPERRALVDQLCASRVPILQETMARVAAHGIRLDNEMVASGMGPGELFPEEEMVGMGLDLQELREAEAGLAESERRLAVAKARLRAQGLSTDTESSEEEDEEDEDEDEEMSEAESDALSEDDNEEDGASAGAAASSDEEDEEDEEMAPEPAAASGGARN